MIYTLPRMLLALSLAFLLAYFFYRGFLWGLKLYRLNNSAYKKIKKGKHLRNGFYTAGIGMSYQNRCWCFTFPFWRFMLLHF